MHVPGLGAEIDPGMALTPFPPSIVMDEIRTHDLPIVSRESSMLTTRPDFRP